MSINSYSLPTPITHMLLSKPTYDPSNDTYITTLFLDKDEEGNFLDVDSMLHHSDEHGFYIARTIIQIWDGSIWTTATNEESESALREHRRSLRVFRPLTPAQVIRMVVEQFVPEEEGARDLTINALRAAGIN